MINDQIRFIFENKKYVVSIEAYPGHRINLPDGRALHVEAWMECYPPGPSGLKLVEYDKNQGVEAVEVKE